MATIGIAELVILLVIAIVYAVPIAIAVWAVLSIKRMRSDHEVFRNRLDTIERLLQNQPSRG